VALSVSARTANNINTSADLIRKLSELRSGDDVLVARADVPVTGRVDVDTVLIAEPKQMRS
jgi:hypothetical protein